MWNDGVYIFKDLDCFSESDLERVSLVLPEYRLEKVKKFKRVLDRKNCVIAYLLLTIALTYHSPSYPKRETRGRP